MNDLLDHRLKKMDHNMKYQKVPMRKPDIENMVHQVTHQPTKRPVKKWMKFTFPMPAVAAIAFLCFQVTNQPSETAMHKAVPLSERSLVTEHKAQQPIESSTNVQSIQQTSGTEISEQKQRSTMVRQTYVMFDDHMFVQTGKRVTETELSKVIGTVKTSTAQEQQRNNAFFPEADIYSIKGADASNKIAIQSRRSTGIGSSSISQQGYFIFEKKEPLPAAQ
ncbi:hypothetical protein MUO14_14290 [Halobacillus shinanisalinarum]|uniref:LPS export ABC transporter periplasmic protein LptC n=1 Tax=Halobacillus shinanisalinarum TaxID=2932258 RepID=A0ABY4GWE8_9BACI|nr:hypothetical protein [Halobacillus shinanisalinarum]UOQ91712.1 hypothetical protein MUO14_14290 [Halobacillus shinanisalinarum]